MSHIYIDNSEEDESSNSSDHESDEEENNIANFWKILKHFAEEIIDRSTAEPNINRDIAIQKLKKDTENFIKKYSIYRLNTYDFEDACNKIIPVLAKKMDITKNQIRHIFGWYFTDDDIWDTDESDN